MDCVRISAVRSSVHRTKEGERERELRWTKHDEEIFTLSCTLWNDCLEQNNATGQNVEHFNRHGTQIGV